MSAYQTNFYEPLIVDYFAGGGGASTGLELAFGRPVDIAVNHDPAAIQLHETNHPFTKHFQESVFDVDLKKECQGRRVAFMWLSPDCTHFSVARGGTPVKKEIRGLAWIAVRAAHDVAPDVIMLENVKEILGWGKLRAKRDPETGRCYKRIEMDGKEQIIVAATGEVLSYSEQVMEPDPKDKGRIWKKFIAALETLGYTCEWRILKGCDYGAPTTRERLFMIARCDGYPIVWAEPTHGNPNSEAVKNGTLLPWRTAAECIDFSKPTPSIFERKKSLAENTLKRIVRGIDKFVIKSGKPFIIPIGYGERKGQAPRVNSIDDPLGTIVSTSKHNVVQPKLSPFINNCQFENIGRRVDEPLSTQLSVRKDFLLTPLLTHYHSATQKDEARGTTLDKPIPTLDTSNRHALTVGVLSKAYGGNYKGAGSELSKPLHTITAQDHNGLIAAHISKYYKCGENIDKLSNPLPTITTKDRMSVVTSNLTVLRNNMDGVSLDNPVPTITAGGGHIAECRTVLVKYEDNGSFGYWAEIRELLNKYGGYSLADDEIILFEIGGELYFLSDIGMRMLEPEELKLAQGFPPDYILDRDKQGRPYPKTEQVAKIGNSVCPQLPFALARANRPDLAAEVILTTMQALNRRIAVSA